MNIFWRKNNILINIVFLDQKVDETYYVGVTRVFGQGWSWLSLEPLPLGVPFWGYDQGSMDGMDCAAVDGHKNYQLISSPCSTERYLITITVWFLNQIDLLIKK